MLYRLDYWSSKYSRNNRCSDVCVCVNRWTVPDSTTVTRHAHMTMLWDVSWPYIQVKYMVEDLALNIWTVPLTVHEALCFTVVCLISWWCFLWAGGPVISGIWSVSLSQGLEVNASYIERHLVFRPQFKKCLFEHLYEYSV